jgi:hypothetical protein
MNPADAASGVIWFIIGIVALCFGAVIVYRLLIGKKVID